MKGENDEGGLQGTEHAGGAMLPIEAEVARGMRFMHLLAMAAQRQGEESARLVEELSKLLIARRVLCDADWAEALQKQNRRDVLP